jgi:hypothetical protein
MLADTLYGSDDNVQKSAKHGIDLLSPVSGKNPVEGKLTIGDFTVDEKTETVTACPAGYRPSKSIHNPETGKTRTMMAAEYCNTCVFKNECPVKRARRGYRFDHTAKQRRLDKRRRDEDGDEFRKVYSKRAGIESTNSGIKRRTGMSRLRVRGEVSVYQAIVLKLAGWNIFQASRTIKAREYVKKQIERVCSLPGSSEIQGILRLSGVKSLKYVVYLPCNNKRAPGRFFQPLLQAV